VKIHVTGIYPNSTLILKSDNQTFINKKLDLDPANGYENTVEVGATLYHELSVSLKDADGNIIISWQPAATTSDLIPEPAKAAKDPTHIESIEQLYLTGLHLEQYRHATYNPTDYYLEALLREKGDVRNNNAMGLWLMKHGQFAAALPYFDTAIETLMQRNPNPQDGEPLFNKGLTLNYLGKKDEAYKAFFKAAWNAAWQDASYFNLAQIDAAKGDFTKALELVDKSLIRNWHNHKARHLKVILLRKMGKIKEAKALIKASLAIDSFNFGVLFEQYCISKKAADLKIFTDLIRDNPHNYLEFAIDYAQAGQYADALKLLSVYAKGKTAIYPMIAYFMGYYHAQLGNKEEAKKHYNVGQKMPKDYCFPNRLEEVVVLKAVMASEKTDATAPYYWGNFWYAARQYAEAKTCWETSIKLNDNNAICHRNLALLYYNKTNEKALALTHLEHAFDLDNTDARLLMELDQLYKKLNKSAGNRLKVLENHLALTLSRDDLYLERASLYNFKSDHQTALDLINQRQFHPWEGGEGKVPFQYINANIELAKEGIKDGFLEKAIKHLHDAQVYPHHLGEGKLAGAQENDIHYWLGCAYEKMGNCALANQYWAKAAEGLSDPSPAYFYNDQQPDKIFYQGMALLKLGKPDEAQKRFDNLVQYGQKHKNDVVKLDYFAVSLPDLLIWEEDLSLRNQIHCAYLTGLGELGLGNLKAATEAFDAVFAQDLFHLSAFIHQNLVSDFALVEV
jgi:tetratricopeptide (TPR) repeat protein